MKSVIECGHLRRRRLSLENAGSDLKLAMSDWLGVETSSHEQIIAEDNWALCANWVRQKSRAQESCLAPQHHSASLPRLPPCPSPKKHAPLPLPSPSSLGFTLWNRTQRELGALNGGFWPAQTRPYRTDQSQRNASSREKASPRATTVSSSSNIRHNGSSPLFNDAPCRCRS
jgi:hypothetical protein